MNTSLATARRLSVPVLVLALIAALAGLYSDGSAGPASFVNAWNQTILLDGQGVYHRDSVSGAAQERGQDLVTLIVALPLLGFAFFASGRGRNWTRVFLAGILGYFLYTYCLLAFGAVYNELFLVYVSVFSLSLFAFVFAVLSVDMAELGSRCAAAYPRKTAMGIMLFIGFLLAAMWLLRIVPALAGGLPPPSIDGYHTMFVQAGDLGILVPAALLSAWWLFRRNPAGYLLATVLLVKGSAMGLAVGMMGVSMNRAGTGSDAPFFLIFVFFALAALCCITGGTALRSMAATGDTDDSGTRT